MRVDPMDRPQQPEPVERRQPTPDETVQEKTVEQQVQAKADAQRPPATVQDSQYTGRGSLVNELA